MGLLGSSDLKEQQRINELQQKITREKIKLDKKLTRQKILLGAFFLETLEKNSVDRLRDYTAKNLPEFLNRETDRKLLSDLVLSLGGNMIDEKDTTADNDSVILDSSSKN